MPDRRQTGQPVIRRISPSDRRRIPQRPSKSIAAVIARRRETVGDSRSTAEEPPCAERSLLSLCLLGLMVCHQLAATQSSRRAVNEVRLWLYGADRAVFHQIGAANSSRVIV